MILIESFVLPASVGIALVCIEFGVRVWLCTKVIMRRSSVGASIIWLLTLLLLPGIGLFLYFLIGGQGIGARRAKRYEQLAIETERRAIELWQHRHEEWSPSDDDYRRIATLVTALGGLPPLKGNSVELMDDAGTVLDRLIADIDASKHHCHLLYYIFSPSGKGGLVCEALIRAAARGVQCRILVDSVGSKQFLRHELAERMRASGVHIVAALPVNFIRALLARIDLRNHRKIAIIDGAFAYCGSQNMTDENVPTSSASRRGVGPFIDTTLRVRGPAVQALQTVFLQDWLLDFEEDTLADLSPYFPQCPPSGNSVVHVISSGPGPRPEAIHQAVLGLIFSAKEEIIMTTPYFIPDPATQIALMNAAIRGVAVTLIVPDMLDARIVAAAGRAYYDELLECGVTIREHKGGLLHAKTFAIDRRLAVITSANFDQRSFWLNFETTVLVYDDDFASVLRFLQTRYMSESVELSHVQWGRRSWKKRFCERLARLLSPLL